VEPHAELSAYMSLGSQSQRRLPVGCVGAVVIAAYEQSELLL
jgi:hypothetical protein